MTAALLLKPCRRDAGAPSSHRRGQPSIVKRKPQENTFQGYIPRNWLTYRKTEFLMKKVFWPESRSENASPFAGISQQQNLEAGR
jgi:hypothetical protein